MGTVPSIVGRITAGGIIRLAALTSGGELPTEFRIFRAGENDTSKGTFLFDDEAAKSVMADYQEHGADLMIDYDHASLGGSMADPALSGRAAGWFGIELRNGELWAVNVRWTPDAAKALQDKEWRYMSPAFGLDDDDRITSLLNVAITNIPATHGLKPLMAASAKAVVPEPRKKIVMAGADTGLSPKLVNQALEAVASKDAKAALDLMKQILAALLGGSPDDAEPTADDAPMPSPDAAAASLSAALERACAVAACSRLALALTEKKTLGEAMTELSRRSNVAVDLEKREAKLAADRATLEGGERRSLVGQLVKLGRMTPAVAWSDDAGTVPSKYFASMPIDDLRDMVTKLSAGGVQVTAPTPPVGGGNSAEKLNEHGLTESQMAHCKATGCDPATFARLKKGSK